MYYWKCMCNHALSVEPTFLRTKGSGKYTSKFFEVELVTLKTNRTKGFIYKSVLVGQREHSEIIVCNIFLIGNTVNNFMGQCWKMCFIDSQEVAIRISYQFKCNPLNDMFKRIYIYVCHYFKREIDTVEMENRNINL